MTSWNLKGLNWRSFSAVEILWLAHLSTIENLKEHKPGQVRLYLSQAKDYTALREWDRSRIKDSD